VIVDSEHVWDEAREELAAERGGRWSANAQRDMMGMSSPEWSRYMHDVVGLDEPPEEISAEVVRRLAAIYREELPVIQGAPEAVRRLAARWPLGLASSSNRELIDLVLDLSGLADCFQVTVSSEEVARGKPAPHVYLEAAGRLGVPPEACAAVEDSGAGIRSAHAAGLRVVAIPNRDFPPPHDVLTLADATVESVVALTPAVVQALA
jgi:HAD superfamily hydrolase (TIGR01509 family)